VFTRAIFIHNITKADIVMASLLFRRSCITWRFDLHSYAHWYEEDLLLPKHIHT